MLSVLGCCPSAEAFVGWIRGNKETQNLPEILGVIGRVADTGLNVIWALVGHFVRKSVGVPRWGKATRAWNGWVFFNNDMDFMALSLTPVWLPRIPGEDMEDGISP